MSASQTRTESKTADELLFNHYLRTGQRLTGQAAQAFLETKGYVAPDRPVQQKSAEMVLFEHYLRTGQRLYGDAAVQFVERKYNHNHDPEDGRFTIGTGGGSLARSSAVQPFRTPRTVAALPTHMAALSHLSVQPMMAARPKPKPNPAPTPPPWARTHPGERLPVWHPRDRSTERGLPADWR